MHTICELHAFRRAAEVAGMSEEEIDGLKEMLARDPEAGDPIVGTGGCRKVRVAGRGKGKSGGYRTITFFSGGVLPLFLLTVFGKGERSDLSQRERNDLRKLTKELAETYVKRVVKAKGRR